MRAQQKIKFFLTFISLLFFASKASASQITPQIVIDLVNQDRQFFGLNSLSINYELTQAAQQKAQDMLARKYFAHISPIGMQPWDFIENNGYDYKFAGENLAINFSDSLSQEIAWMKSEGHRKNILNEKYSDIGVAVARGVINSKETTLTVQMFGRQEK